MNAAEFIEKINASTHFNEVLHVALVKITRESKLTEELDAESIQTTDLEDKEEVNEYEYAILTSFEFLRCCCNENSQKVQSHSSMYTL